ncbi:hypothetical protein B0H13DRAFT_2309550 [Mycena leptocephala]|nr:hypothetical protein B0H13DRAFT_2309550 [Mycena leptocephala]
MRSLALAFSGVLSGGSALLPPSLAFVVPSHLPSVFSLPLAHLPSSPPAPPLSHPPSFPLLSLSSAPPKNTLTHTQAFSRPVRNMKKFEEGVFSDLRNLKPGADACLEEPKVGLLFEF